MTTDKWASWLLSRRDGGDDALRRTHAATLLAFRDGVLNRAAIRAGDVVLDVGAGDGLIGFGALEQVGATGRVVFSDISADLLDECRRRAGDDPRCSFVRCAAERLDLVADSSADVLTTRSVLIYVRDKRAAFAEFFRALRPGGRLSIFEPINRFESAGSLFGYDLTPVADLAAKVRAAFLDGSDPDQHPMRNFDERDLVAWAREAGFTAVTLDFRAEVDVPGPPPADWEALKRTAPNPLAPTYAEAMAATLTDAERDRLDGYVRGLIAAGTPTHRTAATVFLSAIHP
jgi:ubiquinone/menaquinone biosynthesis C-methylase UbiE